MDADYGDQFPCTKCNRMYKHRASLNSHLKLVCGVDPQFRCAECGRRFTWKQHLKRHMVNCRGFIIIIGVTYNLHTFLSVCSTLVDPLTTVVDLNGLFNFDCPKCEKQYKYRSNLVSHLKYECGASETYTCTKCGRSYDKRPSFAKHFKFCGVDFECEYCVISGRSVMAYWRSSNNKHDFVMIDDRYQCPNACGRTYKALHGVRQHLRYECGVKPKFSCSVCTKCFAYKNVLKIHMASVHNVSSLRYGCPNSHCSRSYKNKGSLSFHLKYECGKPPEYQCPICRKSFHQKSNLTKHLRLVHKLSPSSHGYPHSSSEDV
ncbi:Hypothetical protein CINCED_3A011968 [Cinara cedri]|nr:Hypothetical protein CINCED_3A011968 [Cinara cedri]